MLSAKIFDFQIGDNYERFIEKIVKLDGWIRVAEHSSYDKYPAKKFDSQSGSVSSLKYDNKLIGAVIATFKNRDLFPRSLTVEFEDENVKYVLAVKGCYGMIASIKFSASVGILGRPESLDKVLSEKYPDDKIEFPASVKEEIIEKKPKKTNFGWVARHKRIFTKESGYARENHKTYITNISGNHKPKVTYVERVAGYEDLCRKKWLSIRFSIPWSLRGGIT